MLLHRLLGANYVYSKTNCQDARLSAKVVEFRQRQVGNLHDDNRRLTKNEKFTMANRCATRGLVQMVAKPLQKSSQTRLKVAGYGAEIAIRCVSKGVPKLIDSCV